MTTDPRTLEFDAFYRAQAPAVFELALRHAGDHHVATECVAAVFHELRGHWNRISDPLRFCRRAAVLFVCRSRGRWGVRTHHRPPAARPAVRRAGTAMPHRRTPAADQHLPQP